METLVIWGAIALIMTSLDCDVMNIFDDADDMAWYTSALLDNIADNHAPVKSKFVKHHIAWRWK